MIFVFLLVALALIFGVILPALGAARHDDELRTHQEGAARALDVGHSTGRDTAPGPPQAVGAIRPAGGVPDAERRRACVGGRRG